MLVEQGVKVLPVVAAMMAAAIAPLVLGASTAAAWSAGALVALAFVASGLARATDHAGSRPLAPLAPGVVFLGLACATPLIGAAPEWLAPALGLAGAAGLALGGVGALGGLDAQQAEIDALRARLTRREGDVRAQAERIRRLDLLDPATGLYNKRGFELVLERSLAECRDHGWPLALLLVELPETRALDTSAGDSRRRGRRVGAAVMRSVRGSDVAGRLEETIVALLLPDCLETRPAIERVRASLEREGIAEPKRLRIAGVSIGAHGPWPDVEGVLASARAALGALHGAPEESRETVWPIDWGLASIGSTHPRHVASD